MGKFHDSKILLNVYNVVFQTIGVYVKTNY